MKEESKKQVEKVDISLLPNEIKIWQQMTEDNCHSEVCYYIAEFFHLERWERNFFWYTQLEYLTLEQSNQRNKEREQMLDEIKAAYGEDVVNMITKAL